MPEVIAIEAPAAVECGERRRKGRAKVSLPLYVRPSHSGVNHFDDVSETVNVTRDGLYFHTASRAYRTGLRLFITYPYSDAPGALNTDYLAEVVRVDRLSDGGLAVAVRLLMSILTSDHDRTCAYAAR